MKIATIIGARPQFIKAAAISRAIAEHRKNEGLCQGTVPFFPALWKMGRCPGFFRPQHSVLVFMTAGH